MVLAMSQHQQLAARGNAVELSPVVKYSLDVPAMVPESHVQPQQDRVSGIPVREIAERPYGQIYAFARLIAIRIEYHKSVGVG
jgi:hypothetical protein